MISLITDRTEADVLQKNAKGVYGADDLNRVEAFIEDLSKDLAKIDVTYNFKTKTDWAAPELFSVSEWVVESEMKRFLNNVKTVKSALSISTKLPSSMNKLTWVYANNIEKILVQAQEKTRVTIEAFRYSGEIYAGEE